MSRISIFVFLMSLSAVWQSCKRQYDAPPVDDLPVLTANKTIAALKMIHVPGQTPVEVTEDWIIEGVVAADDRTGNFYKSLIIQDSTGGIELRLDDTDLYNNYPQGRKVWVKCRGLFVGDFNGKPQLTGSTAGAAIAAPLIPRYVFRGPLNQPLTPRLRSIDQLTDDDMNVLVRIENVEFTAADMNKTYADAINKVTVNLNVTDCNGNVIVLRTSGYSTFAASNVPDSSGSLTGIYSRFGNTKQFFIRDTTDADMTAPRCTGGGGGGNLMDIATLRAAYGGSAAPAPSGKIRGFVTSDKDNGNWVSKNLSIQDATGGITLRFAANHSFVLGDELEVEVSGVELSEFNGLMQLNNLPNANATVVSVGNAVTPIVRTVAQLQANFEALESTLIQIENATITGGTTYSGSRTINDGTGTITLYTSSFASFAGATIPSGNVNVVGVLSQFTSPQVLMRSAADVTGGTTITYDLNETFSGATANQDIALTGWYNIAQVGSKKWRGSSFSGNLYARVTAYQASPAAVTAWLITPPLNLSQDKYLAFDSEWGFWVHDGLSVWISTDFNGSNAATANWQQLPATIASQSSGQYVWVNSGNIDLSAYTGNNNVHIGFKYVGDAGGNTTTFDIDNIKVWNQ